MGVARPSANAASQIEPISELLAGGSKSRLFCSAMVQSPLYKYLDVEGARKTLGNRCFRHTKASTCNDTEDLTVGSIFPEDEEAACQLIEDGFVDCLVRNVDRDPTGSSGMRDSIRAFQRLLKADPHSPKN